MVTRWEMQGFLERLQQLTNEYQNWAPRFHDFRSPEELDFAPQYVQDNLLDPLRRSVQDLRHQDWSNISNWLKQLLETLIAEEKRRLAVVVESPLARFREEVFEASIAKLSELKETIPL